MNIHAHCITGSVSLKLPVCNLKVRATDMFNEAIKPLLFIIKYMDPQTFCSTYMCAYKWMIWSLLHYSFTALTFTQSLSDGSTQHRRRSNRFLQLRYGIISTETSNDPSIQPSSYICKFCPQCPIILLRYTNKAALHSHSSSVKRRELVLQTL
jgi:hypothetical protein